MQAGRATAVAGSSGLRGCHRTHRGPGRHRVPGTQGRLHGFEAAPEAVPVVDGQHRAVHHHAGEADPSGGRCADHSPGVGPQVHPAVAAEPRPVRRIEAPHHRRPGGERPGPAPCRRRACRHRPRPVVKSGEHHRRVRRDLRRKGTGQRNGEQQRKHREQGHCSSLGALAVPEQAPGRPCGQLHGRPTDAPGFILRDTAVGTPSEPRSTPGRRPERVLRAGSAVVH